MITADGGVSLKSKIFVLTEGWYEICAEMQYDLHYIARESEYNGYIYMNINATGLCNSQGEIALNTRKNGTFGCSIKTNGTKNIMVRYTFIFECPEGTCSQLLRLTSVDS